MLANISGDVMNYWMAGERSRSEWRRRWLWCLALLLLTLAGCSLTTTYRYADRIILWQLDHYFDLNSDQRRDLNQRLTPLLTRHRHEALPEYESFLREIRQRIERGLTGSDVDWAYATYDRLRADLFERVVGDGGVFLASVDASQVRRFETVLQKDNAKAERLVQNPPSERLNKRAQATLDWLKDWLGPLTQEQRKQIHQWSLSLPDTQQVWVAHQQQRQQELLTLLHQPRTPERAAQELRAIFNSPEQTASASYQDGLRQMRDAAKTMALAIDQHVTPVQRRHAVAELQRLIDQVHNLQAG